MSLQGPLLALLTPGYPLLVFRPIYYTSPDRGRDRKVYEVSTLGHSWPQAECVNKETPITLFVQIGKLRYLGQNYTWEMREGQYSLICLIHSNLDSPLQVSRLQSLLPGPSAPPTMPVAGFLLWASLLTGAWPATPTQDHLPATPRVRLSFKGKRPPPCCSSCIALGPIAQEREVRAKKGQVVQPHGSPWECVVGTGRWWPAGKG